MDPLKLGIVGSGSIAGLISRGINDVVGVTVSAVASRHVENAKKFAGENAIEKVFHRWQDLVASNELDAIYVATPTYVREEIAVAALHHGKHVLAEKPFVCLESLQRITRAARDKGVVFMDGTHFSHHPRTAQIQKTFDREIGRANALRTALFFPMADKSNIRFDPRQEPSGAVGDLGWYSMRAIVEFLRPGASIADVGGSVVRDEETNSVIRGAGFISFENGKTSTFDFGYNAGVCLMDMDILGERGMFRLNDFVQDWKHGFELASGKYNVSYVKRSGMQMPEDFETVDVNASESHTVTMIRNFIELIRAPDSKAVKTSMEVSAETQTLLDAFWQQVNDN